LHNTLAWLRDAPASEDREAGLATRFASDWEQFGPHGHAFESIYRAAAEQMIATAMKLLQGSNLPVELGVQNGKVLAISSADRITMEADGIIIRRLKAARLAREEKGKLRHALLQIAAQKQYPQHKVFLEHVSLVSSERQRENFTDRKLKNEMERLKTALQGIEAGRFEPQPDDFRCPRCPYFFICPIR
jgi:DNA helicase-2/ATP-dependent DNA helicase PcrA